MPPFSDRQPADPRWHFTGLAAVPNRTCPPHAVREDEPLGKAHPFLDATLPGTSVQSHIHDVVSSAASSAPGVKSK